MKARISALAAIPALLLLAACGEEPKVEAPIETNDSRTAKGEVLGGTISDEMLPLDTIRSQSPPLSGQSDSGDESGPGDEEEGSEAE